MIAKTLRLAVMALPLVAAAPAWAGSAPVCFRGYEIDNSEHPDDNTILFHMRDGSTYKATTVGRCYGLRNENEGFTFSPTDPGSDEYCANMVTIRLNSTHTVCMLGDFEHIPAKK